MRLTTDDVSSPCSTLDQQSARDQIYQDLGDTQIRLLMLYPAKSYEPLRGELFTCFLGLDAPEYAAISYVWGPRNCMQTIWLHNVQLPITQSLEQCLRRLRKETGAIVLWIDSLCINQDNIEEKSTQVNMMDRIYASSQKVQVWLGAEERYSWVGIQVLEYFATNPRPTTEAPWQTLPPDLIVLGLSEVMSRAWFKRIWVAQEVGLSRKTQMICGSRSFIWTHNPIRVRQFIRMVKYAAIQPEWLHSELARIDMHPLLELLDLQLGQQLDRSWGGSHRSAPDILDIAYDLRHRSSTDPRGHDLRVARLGQR